MNINTAKFIVVENLDSPNAVPNLWNGEPFDPDERLKPWLGDIVNERFYYAQIKWDRIGEAPLNNDDPDEFVIYVVGGDRYKISMQSLQTYTTRLLARQEPQNGRIAA